MPTFRHGKGTVVLADEFDVTTYLSSVSTSNSIEVPETTTFGSSDRSYITGHTDGSISFEGLFDGTADAVDEIFEAALGDGPIMTVSGDGSALSRRAVLLDTKSTAYEVSSPLTEVVSVSGEAVANGGLDYGVWLVCQTAVSTTLTGTANDNSAASSNGGVAHLHVTANTRDGTTVAKIQGSADNSTFADLVTFATISTSTVTSERTEVSGSVARYLRAVVTPAGSTGSLTVSIAFARR
jgi:hypothetical protein